MRPRFELPFAPKLKSIVPPVLLLAATIMVLASCRTLSNEQCLRGDWHLIGISDALSGRPYKHFERHVKTCKRVGVVPDQKLWIAGHAQGARRYCRPENAFKAGQRGDTYHYFCDRDQHDTFLRVYSVGRQSYLLEQQLSAISSRIYGYRSTISDLEEKRRNGKIDAQSARLAIESHEDLIDSAYREQTEVSWQKRVFDERLLREGYLRMAGVEDKP